MKYLYCYDLEIYPNCFLCCVADLVKRKISVFEVSTRKDQRKEMFDYLREAYRNKGWFIGFNNVGFDSPLLHHFLKNQNLTPLQLFQSAGWSSAVLPGWTKIGDYGKTARESSTPVCSSSIWHFWLFYSGDRKQALSV